MLPRNVTTISRMPIYAIMKIKSYLAMGNGLRGDFNWYWTAQLRLNRRIMSYVPSISK